MTRADPYDLQRFVDAQDAGGTYRRAAAELRGGRKDSHWMWFIFPQVAGLGLQPRVADLRDLRRWPRPGPTWLIPFSARG